MSGALSSACCCGGCPTSCCNFWNCSPAGPINIEFSFYTEDRTDIVEGGQGWVNGYWLWTITATLTRSGSQCTPDPPLYANVYRYSATTCNITAQRVTNDYLYGGRWICNQLPICVPEVENGGYCCTGDRYCAGIKDSSGQLNIFTPPYTCSGDPCGTYYNVRLFNSCFSWNCKPVDEEPGGDCAGWGVKDINDFEWKLTRTSTINYSGTISGSGIYQPSDECTGGGFETPSTDPGCPNSWPYVGAVKAGDVITVVCAGGAPGFGGVCGEDCLSPVLIFTPYSSNLDVQIITDQTMDPCCGICDIPPIVTQCYSETNTTRTRNILCGFMIKGSGSCLNESTFKNPTTADCFFPLDPALFPGPGIETACTALNVSQEWLKWRVCNNPDTSDPGECDEFNDTNYCATRRTDCDGVQTGSVQYWPNWTEKRTRISYWNWNITP